MGINKGFIFKIEIAEQVVLVIIFYIVIFQKNFFPSYLFK